MRKIRTFLLLLAACVMLLTAAALADPQVTFLLPINYFCIDEDQTESTQDQLDAYSKDGLLYTFTGDGQILCTVTDQATALQAVLQDMEATFTSAQDPADSMYAKSFRSLEHNADLTEITVICNRDEWGFMDSFYSMMFLVNARDYQRISGVPEQDLKCDFKFVDEAGEVIETDSLSYYLDNVEETEAETEATPVEPSSSGNGLMSEDQLLRLIKWIDDGYYRNKTYEDIVAFAGVEGLDQGHRDTSMTALGDHYFDWISDSDYTHYIHLCFRGRDDSGRFEACQWNTSGIVSADWKVMDLTDWLIATACHETEETALEIQRFSNPLVTVTTQMPVRGWNTRVSSNTAYFYNERGEDNNDPRVEVITFDDPTMFDFNLAHYENVQPAESRVIAGVEMQGRTYHSIGWDWTEYSAQLSPKVSIAVRISRINCAPGTEGGALLDSMVFSWTEEDGTPYTFPGSTALSMVTPEPEPEPTATPEPVVTEAPAPVVAEAPALTDEFLPNDPIEFITATADCPATWQEFTFTNELNGITLSFRVPIDAANGISDFYASKDPQFAEATGRASFVWRYDVLDSTKIRVDISGLNTTSEQYQIKSSITHGAPGENTYTILKTDRGLTLYRRINGRGEAKWVILSDPLSDGSRVLAEIEPAHRGTAGEVWYTELMQAFESTVSLTVPNEQLGGPVASVAVPEPTVEPTEVPVAEPTEAPATVTPEPAAPAPVPEAGPADYAGVWYSTWMNTGAMTGDPRSMFGLTLVLTLNEDGTGDLDYFGSDGGGIWGTDEEGTVRYWGEGTPLSFLEDGTLCYGTTLSGYILFSRDQSAEAHVFPEDLTSPGMIEVTPEPTALQPVDASGNYVGVKYVGKTYIAGGVSMDASILGGEYAVTLNADGTATFIMAGLEMPAYTWKPVEDRIDVDASGLVLMTLTPQADGTMMMDYSGAFTLLMEPQ